MNPKVSVIIPVYNVAPLLERCLDSLLSQSLQDIEFICIDDGSVDGSGDILDRYALKNEKIKVQHSANNGVPTARNLGLSISKGDYITFCDSDDYVDPTLYGSLLQKALDTGADVTLCSILQETSSGDIILDAAWECGSVPKLIQEMFSWHLVPVYNKLFKRSIIGNHRFNKDCPYMEDKLFWTGILNDAFSLSKDLTRVLVTDVYYHYDTVSNNSSLSRRPKSILLKQTLTGIDLVFAELGKNQDVFKGAYCSFLLGIAFTAFWNKKEYDLTDQEYRMLFFPYEKLFRTSIPSTRRAIVLQALSNRMWLAHSMKLLMIPLILKDKILHFFHN